MKLFFGTAFFVLIAFSTKAQWFYDTIYHKNGKISRYGIFDKQKRCYIQYSFFYNGNKRLITQYDSSDFTYNSSMIAFNIDGSKAAEYHSLKGKPVGLFVYYDSVGGIKTRGYYYNGFKTGKWTDYYPDGKILRECYYSLSKEDSLFNEEISIFSLKNLPHQNEVFRWGLRDTSLGYNLEYINISAVGFSSLLSKLQPVCKEYNEKGKLRRRKEKED